MIADESPLTGSDLGVGRLAREAARHRLPSGRDGVGPVPHLAHAEGARGNAVDADAHLLHVVAVADTLGGARREGAARIASRSSRGTWPLGKRHGAGGSSSDRDHVIGGRDGDGAESGDLQLGVAGGLLAGGGRCIVVGAGVDVGGDGGLHELVMLEAVGAALRTRLGAVVRPAVDLVALIDAGAGEGVRDLAQQAGV